MVRAFPALANAHYRLLWMGLVPSILANQMGMVATGYTAFMLTGSATMLAVVGSAVSIPMLFLSLVGGVVADRLPRRNIIVACQTAMGLGTAAVAVLAYLGRIEVWHLIMLGLVNGTAFSFQMPARNAYTADLVGGSLLRSAVSLNNAGMNFTRIAGPALAGFLLVVPVVGIAGTFALMAGFYGVAMFTFSRLPPGDVAILEPNGERLPPWVQLTDGLRYVWRSRSIRPLLFIAFAILLFGMPYQAMLPLFAERVYGAGAQGLGILNAGVGVGALLGSLATAVGSGTSGLRKHQLAAGVGFGVGLLGFGLAPSFPLGVLAVAVVGFCWAAFMAINATLIMEHTEAGLYGRVMSIYLLTFGLMPVSTIPAGWLADIIGGQATVTITGVLVLLCIIVVGLLPSYRQIGDRISGPAAVEVP